MGSEPDNHRAHEDVDHPGHVKGEQPDRRAQRRQNADQVDPQHHTQPLALQRNLNGVRRAHDSSGMGTSSIGWALAQARRRSMAMIIITQPIETTPSIASIR